jgi:class 3 adenylate cyclase
MWGNYDKRLQPPATRGQTMRQWAGAEQLTIVLVFTDIVDSTALCAKLGNSMWIELLIKHFNAARLQCLKCEGYEIKLIGDAYMAAFKTIVDAYTFVKWLYGDTGDPLIEIRAAVHIGEVRIIQGDIFGSMVNYTARVQHSWDGPVIVFSDFAKQALEAEWGRNQSYVTFTRKEVSELKGFEGPQVTWSAMEEGMLQAQGARRMIVQQGYTPSMLPPNFDEMV